MWGDTKKLVFLLPLLSYEDSKENHVLKKILHDGVPETLLKSCHFHLFQEITLVTVDDRKQSQIL